MSVTQLTFPEAKAIVTVYGKTITALLELVGHLSGLATLYKDGLPEANAETDEPTTVNKATITVEIADNKAKFATAIEQAIAASSCTSVTYGRSGSNNQYITGFVLDATKRKSLVASGPASAGSGVMASTSSATVTLDASHSASGGPPTTAVVTGPVVGAVKKLYKMDSATQIFGLDPAINVLDWLFALESRMRRLGVPEDEKIFIAGDFTKGIAFQMAKRKMMDGDCNWESFKSELMARFLPPDHARLTLAKLWRLKQDGALGKFVNDFLAIVMQIPVMTEEDKLNCFLSGLRDKTRAEVSLREPTTLDAAITLAYKLELTRGEGGQDKIMSAMFSQGRQQGRPTTTGKQCFNCKREGHMAKDCRSKPATQKQRQQSPHGQQAAKSSTLVTCFRCKKTGHKKADCHVKMDTASKPGVTFKANYADVTRDYEDVKTLEVLDCNKMSDVQPSVKHNLVRRDGFVNGISMSVSIDCGATASIIGFHAAKAHSLLITPCDKWVKTATDVLTKVIGVVKNVSVLVDGFTTAQDLIVINHKDQDVLLGLDWFHLTGAGVFPKQNVIIGLGSLPTATTRLEDDDEVDVFLSLTGSVDESDMLDHVQWDFSEHPGSVSFEPGMELVCAESNRFAKLIQEHQDVFAKSLADLQGCSMPSAAHEIKLTSEAPIYIRPYKKAMVENLEVRRQVKDMLEQGIIRTSKSPYSAPVIMTPKPVGPPRMCVDFRELNKIMIKQPWPMPLINELIENLSGSAVFSKLDLKAGYWQVKMHDDSVKYTAFSTCEGHYEFLRLPFGLKNAPAEFCRLMYELLGDLTYVQIYLDDITVHSKTTSDHLKHLAEVFKRLRQASLCCNPEKCEFLAPKISLLGHVVSGEYVGMDPKKVECIMQRVPPTNVLELQRWIGLVGYYRRFIKNYAAMTYPMNKLLRKNTKFDWGDECKTSFESMKIALCSEPILRQPVMTEPFLLYCDASGYAISAILSQKCDGFECVIDYGSRTLKGAEIHYIPTEKECLAVVFGVQRNRNFLYGQRFTIITDCSALKWLMGVKDPHGRLARWAIYIQGFEFDIVHRAGVQHANADTLSRPVTEKLNKVSVMLSDTVTNDIYVGDHLKSYVVSGVHLPGSSSRQVRRVLRAAPHYCHNGGDIRYRKNVSVDTWRLVARPDQREKLIEDAHALGHFQALSVYNRLCDDYYWNRMLEQVKSVVASCVVCQRNDKGPSESHPARALPVNGIFDRVGIDLVFGLPETEDGYKGLVVITEYLSKFPVVRPIKSKSATEIVAHLWDYVCLFGPPKEILSDQGREFINTLVEKLTNVIGSEHRVTSAYHPRTNGQTERFNQTFVAALRKHAEDDQMHWVDWIPYVLYAYRGRVHSSTELTPFELMFGRKINTFSVIADQPSANDIAELVQRSREIKEMITGSHSRTVEKLQGKQEIQKAVQDSAPRPPTNRHTGGDQERRHLKEASTTLHLAVQGSRLY